MLDALNLKEVYMIVTKDDYEKHMMKTYMKKKSLSYEEFSNHFVVEMDYETWNLMCDMLNLKNDGVCRRFRA